MSESVRRAIKILLVVWGMLADIEGVLTDKIQASRVGQSACHEFSGAITACAGPWQHAESVKAAGERDRRQGRHT